MWTAATLWIVIGGGAAVYAYFAARSVAAGAAAWKWIVAAPIAYLALIGAFTLVYFLLAWLWRSKRPSGARLTRRSTWRLIWREYWTIAGSAPRMMLYRWLVRDPAPARATHPVLLLHGVLCNAGVWASMKPRLEAAGLGPIYALSYGPPLASIELFADQTAAKIDAILAETGAASVAIVTHSMGGLVARAYLRKYGGDRVRQVVTIGAPHAGSVHAWMFPGASLAQLRPRNRWLGDLPPTGADAAPPFVSVWSWHDSMVAPQTSARLEGAENVELSGIGHNALLTDPEVAKRVVDVLRRPVSG
ncbi:Extracellular esterase EstB [Burkholderiales bacterium]|nr:Extracellular esterase EstB [Burkholderiales bacterium]